MKTRQSVLLPLTLNAGFALFHGILGIALHSWWFLSLCAYYIILSTTRFAVLYSDKTSRDTEFFILKVCGVLLMLLSLALSGVICISLSENIATRYDTIVMIAIAAYTFFKIGMAIARAIIHRRNPLPLHAAVRCISYAEVAASLLTMQRSMLVSFGDVPAKTILIMNALTGAAVCLFIFLLGANLWNKGKEKNIMAKSKLVKASEKIAGAVTGAYNKIEHSVVNGYTKIEDAFVDHYLTKEGESVEAAKKRLKKETNIPE